MNIIKCMNNKKILITGSTGLVGSRIMNQLQSQYEFEMVGRKTGVDITDEEAVKRCVDESDASVILHLAAKTNVDECEDDKILGEEGDAWRINVFGTENMLSAAKSCGKRFIFISTDFVFDGVGTKEYYTEEDEPNPVNWYGETKYQGELKVQQSGLEYMIFRICYPYCKENSFKQDFVHKIITRLEKNEKVFGVTDHIFTPTYIDDIAITLDRLMATWVSGVYHLAGAQALSPYEAAVDIAKQLSIDSEKIIKTTRSDFFRGKAFRPFNVALKNDKIEKLGIRVRSFSNGIKEFLRKEENT